MQPTDSPTDFHSILFEGPSPPDGLAPLDAPACFRDLNLDQVVDAVAATRPEYDLKPFFHARLTRVSAIAYRHAVMRDMERHEVCQSVELFSGRMCTARRHLATAEKCYYRFEKERWHLDGAAIYCRAVDDLLNDLRRLAPASAGLRAFCLRLARYTDSEGFSRLRQEARGLTTDLAAVRYCLLIRDGSVTVTACGGEADYTAVVEETFARFRQAAASDYLTKLPELGGMGHVGARLLELVARLFPDVFGRLTAFMEDHRRFQEEFVLRFEHEVQFYTAWLRYAETFTHVGLPFCYPHVSDAAKSVSSRESYDLALARKLLAEGKTIVRNDFVLDGQERTLVVTGPNQGGKTTFARTVGQLYYLAALGCPVPGTEARLFLCDEILTHFDKAEDIATLRGKLQDELVRLRAIFERATPRSLLILNEVFSSTALRDAVWLSRKVMARVSEHDMLCVWVTFLDELASFDGKTVSVVAMVAPEDPTQRTYRVERRPPDGLSYALAVAARHRLTYDRLKERLPP